MKILPPDCAYLLLASLCASVGAFFDIRARRIPNLLTLSIIVLGLLMRLSIDGWKATGLAAVAGLVGGAIFLVFWLAGGMGAGDVKLMAGIGCIAGTAHLAQVLVVTALMGGLFAIALAAFRGRLRSTLANVGVLVMHHRTAGLQPHPELNVLNAKTLRLPYAVAIAAGCWITFLSQAVLR